MSQFEKQLRSTAQVAYPGKEEATYADTLMTLFMLNLRAEIKAAMLVHYSADFRSAIATARIIEADLLESTHDSQVLKLSKRLAQLETEQVARGNASYSFGTSGILNADAAEYIPAPDTARF